MQYICVTLSFFAVILCNACCHTSSSGLILFEDELRRTDAVILCDVFRDGTNIAFVVQDVWRMSPDVLTNIRCGDMLDLAELNTFREYCLNINLIEEHQVFFFLTDLYLRYPNLDPPLLPTEDRFAVATLWSKGDTFLSDMHVSDLIKMIEGYEQAKKKARH